MSNQLPELPRGDYFDAQMRRETFSADQMEEYARAALAARSFAQDCHDLTDRCTVILRSNPDLRPREKHLLRLLVAAGHAVGDNAECAPHLYTEAK